VHGAGDRTQSIATLLGLLRGGASSDRLSTLGPLIPELAGQHPSVPEPGIASALLGVFCTSRSDCWAVGTYQPKTTTDLNLVLHWNGSRWRRSPVPDPAGTGNGDASALTSVRCARVTDCWAVGVYERMSGAIFSEALHWNGRRWSFARTPEVGGAAKDSITLLADVVCPSSVNCWAVGEFGNEGVQLHLRNEALHWNGKKWALAGTPEPAGTAIGDINELASVRCTSGTNCLAIGTYGTVLAQRDVLNQALRWNGRKWSSLSVPNPGGAGASGDTNGLHGLACTSADNCWAVGSFSSTASAGTLDQVLHWNGSTWSQIAVPEPGGSDGAASEDLFFATCSSPTNCWAVGEFAPVGSSQVTADLAVHWDGGMWSIVDTPDPAGVSSNDFNELAAVRCVSANNCWAVGLANVASAPDFAQLLHWDGTRWSAR
jgi:hypothetical protein